MKTPEQMLQDWLAALRNPENEQTQSILKDPGTGARCCLGVLIDESGIKGKWKRIDPKKPRSGENYGFFPDNPEELNGKDSAMSFVGNIEIPATLVRRVTGDDDFEVSDLAARNDGAYWERGDKVYRQHTFPEIADYIEQKIAKKQEESA